MIRILSKAVGAVLILGLLSPSLALADTTTVATVAPDASAAAATTGSVDVAQAGPLSDVPQNSWAYDAVDQLVKDGIIKGYPNGTFKGNRPMTRYEAAVLAYRAVDMIEAQITAGKAVEKSDIAAANKLLTAYGAELKAVERHVDALQKEADETNTEVKGEHAQIGALNAFTKKAFFKITDIDTQMAYGANLNANCGVGTYAGNGPPLAAYCNHVGGGNALLPGTRFGGYQPVYGGEPPSGALPNGQRNAGQNFNFYKLTFTGTPTANTAFLAEMTDTSRPSDLLGRSINASDCIPSQNFLNGNAAEAAPLTNCSVINAAQAGYNQGGPGFAPGFTTLWGQVEIPNSGLYLRAGHLQNNMGPTAGSWIGGDWYWGAMIGLTKGAFNGYVGYGVDNSALTNFTLQNVPSAGQDVTVEADYTFRLGKGSLNLGTMYTDYSGQNSLMWDPSAVECTGTAPVVAGVGTAGQTRFFANTTAVPFTTCGAGFAPVTYSNGAPITGQYLSAQNNNPTVSGTTAFGSYATPGLIVTNPISMIAGDAILSLGKLRLQLSGTYHLGNDPYTGAAWVGPLSGSFVADYGPAHGGPHTAGKWTYEAQGFGVQFNGQLPNVNDFGGPILDNSWSTNWGGLYWLEAGLKYWVSDDMFLGVGYGHTGLLPNTVLPAGNAGCPGCVVSGFTQNAAFLQMNMAF